MVVLRTHAAIAAMNTIILLIQFQICQFYCCCCLYLKSVVTFDHFLIQVLQKLRDGSLIRSDTILLIKLGDRHGLWFFSSIVKICCVRLCRTFFD